MRQKGNVPFCVCDAAHAQGLPQTINVELGGVSCGSPTSTMVRLSVLAATTLPFGAKSSKI